MIPTHIATALILGAFAIGTLSGHAIGYYRAMRVRLQRERETDT